MLLQVVGATSDPPLQPIDPATFDEFWCLWPQERRVCKKDARLAWGRLTENNRVQALTALCVWRQVWGVRGEWEYVVHPHRWLSHERWQDELPPGYSLMPRMSAKAAITAPEPQGERVPMPEHVKALLAKLKGGKQ